MTIVCPKCKSIDSQAMFKGEFKVNLLFNKDAKFVINLDDPEINDNDFVECANPKCGYRGKFSEFKDPAILLTCPFCDKNNVKIKKDFLYLKADMLVYHYKACCKECGFSLDVVSDRITLSKTPSGNFYDFYKESNESKLMNTLIDKWKKIYDMID